MARYVIVKFSTTRTSISDILTLSDGIFNGLKGFMFIYFTSVTFLYFKHTIFAKRTDFYLKVLWLEFISLHNIFIL